MPAATDMEIGTLAAHVVSEWSVVLGLGRWKKGALFPRGDLIAMNGAISISMSSKNWGKSGVVEQSLSFQSLSPTVLILPLRLWCATKTDV